MMDDNELSNISIDNKISFKEFLEIPEQNPYLKIVSGLNYKIEVQNKEIIIEEREYNGKFSTRYVISVFLLENIEISDDYSVYADIVLEENPEKYDSAITTEKNYFYRLSLSLNQAKQFIKYMEKNNTNKIMFCRYGSGFNTKYHLQVI